MSRHREAGHARLLVGVSRFEMCSGSEAGSYLTLIDFVCHSTLGLRVIMKKKRSGGYASMVGTVLRAAAVKRT